MNQVNAWSKNNIWLVFQAIALSITGAILGVFGAVIFDSAFGTFYGVTTLGCWGGATIVLICFLWLKGNKRVTVFIGTTALVIILVWWYRDYQEKASIVTRYTQFYLAIEQQNHESAYTYMSPFYQQSHTLEQFESDFDFIAEPDSLTTITEQEVTC